ncbi:YxeA family protein [Geobacillus thermodenitrificans]|uniref:YxeA family protein n=1 Tax=Geobacillus thermodenitrificans TaxID=33940 RepID=UPI002E2316DC|nr:hypothetical protein [Geobacillus thermodenitrificans]
MKKIIGIIIALVVVFVGFFTVVPEEDRDHINPFIPKEVIYVQIYEDPAPHGQGYKYTLTGYTEDGEEKKITFTAGKVLKEKAILKVNAKGSFVEKWEEVQPEELPEKVRGKMDSVPSN